MTSVASLDVSVLPTTPQQLALASTLAEQLQLPLLEAGLDPRKLEAGMVLMGSEVKSLRNKQGDLDGSYAGLQDGELYRMYYRGSHADEKTQRGLHREVTCYAESRWLVTMTSAHPPASRRLNERMHAS